MLSTRGNVKIQPLNPIWELVDITVPIRRLVGSQARRPKRFLSEEGVRDESLTQCFTFDEGNQSPPLLHQPHSTITRL